MAEGITRLSSNKKLQAQGTHRSHVVRVSRPQETGRRYLIGPHTLICLRHFAPRSLILAEEGEERRRGKRGKNKKKQKIYKKKKKKKGKTKKEKHPTTPHTHTTKEEKKRKEKRIKKKKKKKTKTIAIQ